MLLRASLAIAFLLLAWRGSAEAHTGGTTGFAAVTISAQAIRYTLTLSLDALQRAKVDPVLVERVPLSADYDALVRTVARHITIAADGDPCESLPGTVQPPSPDRPNVVIIIHYACAKPVHTLLLRDDMFDVLGRDHHTLANVEWPGGREQLVFDPDRRDGRVALGGHTEGALAADQINNGVFGFFRLGVEHILTGFDHILFLFALILGGGRMRSLLGIVTAFTLAHSVTLALAALDLARPPSRLIEPLIAFSIAYVAFENIFLERAPSRRWLVSLVFGFVHGFGFAGALLEIGLPDNALFSSLLFFNLGVEAGQAMIIAILFPALLFLSRFPWKRRAVTAISAAVLVAAIVLLGERALLG